MQVCRDYQSSALPAWTLASGAPFSPLQVNAVSAWLRVAGGTITGSGYSSVPDQLASNPATQSTDADRPPSATSANGFPIMDLDGTSDFLSWPAASNNNTTSVGGIGLWLKPDIVTAQHGIIVSLPGATNRVDFTRNNADLLIDVYISQFSARRGVVSSVFSAGTWYFITWEFDGSGANDAAKCVLTVNGVAQTVTFSDGTGAPGAMPAALVSTAGPFLLGCRVAGSHTGCWDGKFGPNIYVFGAKMTGATTGLLTSSARNSLMTFEQPT